MFNLRVKFYIGMAVKFITQKVDSLHVNVKTNNFLIVILILIKNFK